MNEKETLQPSSEEYVAPKADKIVFCMEDAILESEDNDVAFGA